MYVLLNSFSSEQRPIHIYFKQDGFLTTDLEYVRNIRVSLGENPSSRVTSNEKKIP